MAVSTISSNRALALEDLLVEFGDLAEQLQMTQAEQAGVTALPMSVAALLSQGVDKVSPPIAVRCARRLTYCVPLLRQMLLNARGGLQTSHSTTRNPRVTRGDATLSV